MLPKNATGSGNSGVFLPKHRHQMSVCIEKADSAIRTTVIENQDFIGCNGLSRHRLKCRLNGGRRVVSRYYDADLHSEILRRRPLRTNVSNWHQTETEEAPWSWDATSPKNFSIRSAFRTQLNSDTTSLQALASRTRKCSLARSMQRFSPNARASFGAESNPVTPCSM